MRSGIGFGVNFFDVILLDHIEMTDEELVLDISYQMLDG